MTPVRFVVLALLVIGLADTVPGCTCAGRPSACELLGQTTAVFIGKMNESVQSAFTLGGREHPRQRVTFDVLESFQGTREPRITVSTGMGGGDCGFPFAKGKVYLIYATGDPSDLWTGICARTAPVDLAREDVEFLRSLASKGTDGRISGYTSTIRPGPGERFEGKSAVPGVTIWLESDQGRRKTTTDPEGRYEFPEVLPGRYRVWADMPGKLGGGAPVNVTLAPQSCSTVVFIAKEQGAIRGTIRDANGQPVTGAWIELLRAPDGTRTGIEHGFTDDDGSYAISSVPKGEYLVGLHVSNAPNGTKYLWQPYTRSYYPGVPDASGARIIAVDSAQVVSGIDWSAGLPLHPRRIRGVVLGPDGKPASRVFVELKVDGYQENAALKETGKDGAFALDGLTDLRYFVQASSGWEEGSEAWHCHRVTVPEGDTPLTLTLNLPGKDCDSCRKKR